MDKLTKQIAITSLSFLLLVLWYFIFKISCISMIIPLIISFVLFKISYEYANAKKICFANCYFKQNSFFYKILTKKIIILTLSILNGIILSLILTLNITTFNMIDFIVLLMDTILIIYLYNYFIENKSLNNNLKDPIVKNSVSFINSIIIAIVFLIINLNQTPPKYIQNDLNETVHKSSNQIYSTCKAIDSVTRLTNEIVAIKWWIMLKMSNNSNNQYYIKEILWIIYLFGNYLMIFAFSRYILEILSLLKKEFEYDRE